MSSPQPDPEPMPSEWSVFRPLVPPEVLNALHPPAPQAVYTPWVVTWLLVYPRLHNNGSLQDAVTHFLFSFPVDARPECKRCREQNLSANTGTHSAARSNLPDRVLQAAAERVLDTLVGAYPPSWHDRRVFLVDGTTLSLVGTQELAGAFTPASNPHGRSHRPVMHPVVAHELAGGLAAAPRYGAMYGPEAVSEVDLGVRLLPALPARAVLLAGRNFGIFGFAHGAVGAGHDVVVRLTPARFRALVKKGAVVEPGRWSLTWKPSPHDRKAHPRLPDGAVVRGWLHEVRVRGDLTRWRLSTVEATGTELGALYGRRVDVETDIRNLKVALELDQLRGRDESMVVKELWAALVTYNLTVQARRVAAERLRADPRRLSFTGVLSLVRGFLSGLHGSMTEAQHQARFEPLLRAAGQRKLPKRAPDRRHPREVIPRRRKFPERKRVKPPPD